MTDTRFVKNARRVGQDDASRATVLVAIAGVSEPATVHVFDTEESFRSWASASPANGPVLRLDDEVARARTERPVDARVKELSDQAVAGLYDLAERHGLQPVEDELLRRATLEPPVRFEALMVLFDAYGLSGGWRPVTGTVPVLDWVGFAARTSSVWIAGAGVLSEHPWFAGRRLYLVGAPFSRFDDLRELGFDNRASAAAVL